MFPKSSQKKFQKWLSFYLVFVMAVLIFVAGISVGSRGKTENPLGGAVLNKNAPPPANLSRDVDFALFWDVWNILKDRYVDQPVKDPQLFYGALEGLAASLGDPYTAFFPPVQAEEFTRELQGSFDGIGAEVGMREKQVTVVSPLPDSPAERAGLRPGDAILAVDGRETAGLAIDEAVRLIRGPKGTIVTLLIGRDRLAPFEVKIKRDVIVVKSVRWEVKRELEGPVGVIRILQFNEETSSLLDRAIRETLAANPKGLVLDLRGNPGGLLDTAISIAGEWLPGEVVVRERRAGGAQLEHRSDGKGRLRGAPTVVLINQGSASASEILAGALQDAHVSRLVGMKTFGKGSVQDYQTLRDGSGLKVTIAEWLTPANRSINKQGIAPDIEVDRTEAQIEENEDPQQDTALALLLGRPLSIPTASSTPVQ